MRRRKSCGDGVRLSHVTKSGQVERAWPNARDGQKKERVGRTRVEERLGLRLRAFCWSLRLSMAWVRAIFERLPAAVPTFSSCSRMVAPSESACKAKVTEGG